MNTKIMVGCFLFEKKKKKYIDDNFQIKWNKSILVVIIHLIERPDIHTFFDRFMDILAFFIFLIEICQYFEQHSRNYALEMATKTYIKA